LNNKVLNEIINLENIDNNKINLGKCLKQKTKEILDLTIHDALANLSALADMKIDIKEPIGIVKKHKIVIQDEEFSYKTIDWFLKEDAKELIDNIKMTYLIVYEYIKEIYKKNFIDWDDPKCRRGFQAIMVMATEAANKIDQYIELLPQQPGLEKISDSFELKQLKELYLEKIAKKFTEALEGEEAWLDEWKDNEKSLLLDVEKSGLKDFEILKKDEEYELFYLVDDEERPFFDPELIRNIKLFCEYDQEALKKIEEDPLLRIRIFLDKDFQESSKQILDNSYKYIDKYFSEKYQKEVESDLIGLINEAIFALMLASNPKNLITHSFLKNSIEYFHDFQEFLRDILESDEYQKIIAYTMEDKRSKCLVELIHILCKSLYLRNGCIKQETIGFIYLLIRKGDELRKFKYPKKASFWNTLLENDESIQLILNSYPNGPLMKLLDVVRLEIPVGFDPILQDNVPMKIFEIHYEKNEMKIIRTPSPTMQNMVSQAKIVEEFKGFLRSFKPNEKYLFINLQDKTSFKESSRCLAIESLQKKADFRNNIFVVTIDKHSDFYHQSGIYLSLNNAKDFLKEFKNELLTNKNSSLFVSKELDKFINETFEVIHKYFFVNKNVFTRKNRLDFIEIFHNFLVLKLIEMQRPKVLSFTCKDSIDIGAMFSASFFAFLKLIKNEKFTKEVEDYFRWLSYAPAIFVRERSVNSALFVRNISALNCVEMELITHKEKVIKALSSLYSPVFLKSLKIIQH
jgi:hypothetical protein